MAALPTYSPTLIDWGKTLDPDGTTARFINMLAQKNQILLDLPFEEGNLETGSRVSMLTGLPTVAWRLLNGGIVPSKPTYQQIDEQAGMLEGYSQQDVDLAKLNGNVESFRMSQNRPFFEAMNQTMATAMFYGTMATPESFVGLSVRYSSLSAGNGGNIIDGGGTGTDNASIWLLGLDAETITGIYPRGSSQGLSMEDLGIQLIQNAGGVTGALMQAFVAHWQWKCGIAVKDWRYGVRIANLDISNLVGNTTPADIIEMMEHAESLLPDEFGKRVWYMNRTIARFLRKQARAAVSGGGGLTYENFDGKRILVFGDSPVRIVDALLNTEARVV